MPDYQKTSPNYWCKHCACYVRDTKLERQNHESTARHQNAIKRSLRDLHRNHEREERDKERARREIDRLNGVVTSFPSGPSRPGRAGEPGSSSTETSLKKQREQLAEMGVSVPDDFRGEMAMPGEWTVTSTRVIEGAGDGPDGDKKADRLATGVRKRGDNDDKDEEDALKGLFKKPRRWGRDSKSLPTGEDEELDALLSGTVKLKREVRDMETGTRVKDEVDVEEGIVKEEDDAEADTGPDTATRSSSDGVKVEEDGDARVKLEESAGDSGIAPVVFKKRKPKGLRTK